MKTLSLVSIMAVVIIFFSSCTKEFSFNTPDVLVPLTVMDDASLPAITINGVRLHAETYGNPNDPILLVIHGGPGSDYRSILNFSQLADDSMFVVFYDQRGAGLSQRLEASAYTDVQEYIEELDAVIQHYRQNINQPVVLAGHSWGAILATAYINQHPNAITGAVLAEPGGFTWEQTIVYINKSRTLNLLSETTNDQAYMDQFITSSQHNTLDYKLALLTAGNRATGDTNPPSFWRYGAICNSASIALAIADPEKMNFTTHLQNYRTKVLFAYSELNPAYGVEHARMVSSAFPAIELVEIPDCGHEMPQFGWPHFYPLIQNYLKEIL
ncbi:MAG: alpha/beta fold hydrolase [Aureispira sp.]